MTLINNMIFEIQKTDPVKIACDLLVLPWFAETKIQGGATSTVDKALGGLISKIAHDDGFEGKEGQTLIFRTLGKLAAKHVLIVGLGAQKSVTLEMIRRVAAVSVRKAKEASARTIAVAVFGPLAPRDSARAMTEGALLADYRFSKFRKEDVEKEQKKGITTFTFIEKESAKIRLIEQGMHEGTLEANAAIMARDLVNEPSLHMSPAALKAKAEHIVNTSNGKIKIKVYDKAALEKMGAGGILAVAMGSDHPPYLVHMIWKPARAKKKVALVGKAITFDSGGLSLKPADSMMTMKMDMAGAAAVLGVFSVLPALNLPIEIHGIFAACENMPSGKAIRPGDIVQTMSGKTIEILNTDAEGRVTLADSLHYATTLNPDYIVDLATLTGACMVALGEGIAGLMTNDKKLGDKLKSASEVSGEPIWELPLPREYRELTVSKFADLKNIAGKMGGAITAGLFLEEFVDELPWAHLDIAGPAFVEHETVPYLPLGATGFGVRTLIHFLNKI